MSWSDGAYATSSYQEKSEREIERGRRGEKMRKRRRNFFNVSRMLKGEKAIWHRVIKNEVAASNKPKPT